MTHLDYDDTYFEKYRIPKSPKNDKAGSKVPFIYIVDGGVHRDDRSLVECLLTRAGWHVYGTVTCDQLSINYPAVSPEKNFDHRITMALQEMDAIKNADAIYVFNPDGEVTDSMLYPIVYGGNVRNIPVHYMRKYGERQDDNSDDYVKDQMTNESSKSGYTNVLDVFLTEEYTARFYTKNNRDADERLALFDGGDNLICDIPVNHRPYGTDLENGLIDLVAHCYHWASPQLYDALLDAVKKRLSADNLALTAMSRRPKMIGNPDKGTLASRIDGDWKVGDEAYFVYTSGYHSGNPLDKSPHMHISKGIVQSITPDKWCYYRMNLHMVYPGCSYAGDVPATFLFRSFEDAEKVALTYPAYVWRMVDKGNYVGEYEVLMIDSLTWLVLRRPAGLSGIYTLGIVEGNPSNDAVREVRFTATNLEEAHTLAICIVMNHYLKDGSDPMRRDSAFDALDTLYPLMHRFDIRCNFVQKHLVDDTSSNSTKEGDIEWPTPMSCLINIGTFIDKPIGETVYFVPLTGPRMNTVVTGTIKGKDKRGKTVMNLILSEDEVYHTVPNGMLFNSVGAAAYALDESKP